jgi:hypothetical protein
MVNQSRNGAGAPAEKRYVTPYRFTYDSVALAYVNVFAVNLLRTK